MTTFPNLYNGACATISITPGGGKVYHLSLLEPLISRPNAEGSNTIWVLTVPPGLRSGEPDTFADGLAPNLVRGSPLVLQIEPMIFPSPIMSQG
jgi:hypothetical protein